MSVAAFSDHPFPISDDPRGRKRLSKPFVIALTLSVAAHAGVGAYMAYKKFVMPIARSDEGPVIIIEPPPQKPPVVEPEPDPNPPPQSARQLHVPVPSPFTPIDPLPVEPVEVAELSTEPPRTLTPGPVDVISPPEPPRPPSVIERPDWLKKPTAAQVANAYPERALMRDIGGTAKLSCKVTAIGAVRNCVVVSETPSEYGFGAAALKLSKNFQMKPQTVDGAPVEGASVTIPLTFRTN
jgi:protein TonB